MKNVNMVITRDMDFENVLQSIMPMIRSIARQADGVCGLEMEDVEQELSIQAYRSWETWEPERGSKFSTYVYETLVKQKNCLIRTAKAQKRNGGVTPESLDKIIDSKGRDGKECCLYDFLPDPSQDPEEQIQSREIWEAVERALDGMQEKGRRVVIALLEGQTQFEVSRAAGISQPLISYYLKSFRTKVRTELGKGWTE